MDVNEAVVSILESVGVDHVFGGSGQVNATMLLALRKSQQIKTVIVRNEQAASFMACGYAMYSDRLGVCFATGGPGAFNLFSGLAVAYSDSLPVLGITGYVSAGMKGKGALNESSGLNRTPDSQQMFSATTKKSFILTDPDQVCDVFEQAIYTAFEGRPGPVHVHIPKDITGAEVTRFRPVQVQVPAVLPDPDCIAPAAARLAQALRSGEQFGLLAGYGAVRSRAEKELLDFIQAFQVPFMTTMDAKGILPEDHPLSLGVYGTSGDPGANAFFDGCRLILALGNSFAQNATFAYRPDLYAGKDLIHVNIDPAEIGKVYPAQYPIVSDIRPALQALHSQLAGQLPALPKRELPAGFRDKWFDRPLPESDGILHPGELSRLISRRLPQDALVLGDAGSGMLWLNCYLKLNAGQRYQNPGSFGPMASHVNGAIGVKCANPERVVVCGCGDGAYLMAGFELLTAVQYDIPVIWVIFNNGEFNIIKKFLIDLYGDHAYMTFENPDYVQYAGACRAQGFRVETAEQFDAAFDRALQLNRPVIIDVAVASDVYPPFSLGRV